MKQIKAVIRPEKLQDVLDALEAVGYNGVMVTEIDGHGNQKGVTQSWRGEKYQLQLIPKIMLDLIVKDADLKRITDAVMESAKAGANGDGKIFIYDVENVIRIRTGEEGEGAI